MSTHDHVDKSVRTAPDKKAATHASQPDAAAILQRMENAPQSIRPADILQLQRTIGNRATGRILQAKLKLGPAGDAYEQEADRVAKQVVHASRQPDVQRGSLEEEELQMKPLADSISQVNRALLHPLPSQRLQRYSEEEEEIQAKRTFGTAPQMPQVQREEMGEEELQAKRFSPDSSPAKRAFVAPPQMPKVQREEMDEEELQASPNHGLEGGDVDDGVARSIQNAKGGGAPLHDGIRSSMEQGFGADFSGVRVHTGGQADALNRSLNARAFTTGNDIFFGKGQYNPGSTGGQELIAHELTHTVQQGASTVRRFPANIFTNPYASWETDNPTVSSPGEGAKGGVYFLRTVAGPVNSVAVKPLIDESPAQSQFGDQLLQTGFDINTPNSRIVRQGTDEFQSLLNIVKPHADNKKPPEKTDEEMRQLQQQDMNAFMEWMNARMGYVPIEETKAFKVMEKVNASSLSSIISDAGDQQGVDRLLVFLRNNGLLQQIGTLAVADALMGNDDRLSISGVKNMTNLGNYMISDNGDLFAIDTATNLRNVTNPQAIQRLKNDNSVGMQLSILGEPDGAQRLADLFLGAIQQEVTRLPADQNFSPLNYYNNQVAGEVGNVRTQIGTGIQNGLTKIKNILLGATPQDEQKRDQLESDSKNTYGVEGRHSASFESLVANLSYLESYKTARQGGANATDSQIAGATSYGESMMATTGNVGAINALKEVDAGALSIGIPGGFDKKAKSARIAVERGQIVPEDIAKWVQKYEPDLHIHALRVASAMQAKNGLIRGAVAVVRDLANGNSTLANTQLREYAKAYDVANKHVINLRLAAGKIMLRLDGINQKGKYTTFIDLLRLIQNRLQHTQQQFSQYV